MMGYTHIAIGTAGALMESSAFGKTSIEEYVIAVLAGAFGGIIADIDVKDHISEPRMTDGGRSRLEVLGLVCLGALLDWKLQLGMVSEIYERRIAASVGSIALLIMLVAGHFTPHRTMTHSFLYLNFAEFV